MSFFLVVLYTVLFIEFNNIPNPKKYGVSNTQDKVVKGIDKTLIHLTNWISLIEYFPDSSDTKIKKSRRLRKYKQDPFF